jgi:sarcosine oxidase, subunit beta
VLPGISSEPPARRYDVVIVGGGVQGLALAYELGRRGVTSVAVLDRSWPGSGASGRNGEMIRSAFASTEWSRLFHHSLARWATLSAELDYNVLFTPAGYLILASTEEEVRACHDHAATHARLGIDTEVLDAPTARRLLPAASPDLVLGGLLQPRAGFAHHDAVVWAYLRAAARLGVQVFGGVEVHGVQTAAGRVTGVQTSRGPIAAGAVVNAAGAAAPQLNRTAGLMLTLIQARLEMIVTQALKPFLRYAVASPHLLGYCHQTGRGEFVGGTELPCIDETASLNATYELLRDMARKWVRLFPALAGVRLLRHWAGSVSQAPDLAPVLGAAPGLAQFYLTIGWVYGFMGAPGSADLLAEQIVTGRISPLIEPFSPQRLLDGRFISEPSLVVPADGAPAGR